MDMSMRAARVNVNKTILEAANEIGVSEKTIRNWEAGGVPSGKYILRILECYNCTFEDIRFSTPKTTV